MLGCDVIFYAVWKLTRVLGISVTDGSVSKLRVEAMSQMVLMDKAYVASLRNFGLRISPH